MSVWQRYSASAALLVLLGVGLLSLQAGAEERLPSKDRLFILLTVLSYDTNIDRFQGTGLRIGVVGRNGNAQSTKDAEEMLQQLRGVSTKTVKSHAIHAFPVSVSSLEDLTMAASDLKLNVFYLCSDLGELRAPMVSAATERGILVMAGEAETVRGGAAIGAVAKDSKPQVLINLKAATAQGAKLDARILRLAQVIQ